MQKLFLKLLFGLMLSSATCAATITYTTMYPPQGGLYKNSPVTVGQSGSTYNPLLGAQSVPDSDVLALQADGWSMDATSGLAAPGTVYGNPTGSPAVPVATGKLYVGVNGPNTDSAPFPRCTNNCDVLVGVNAGASLASSDHYTVAVGFNALASVNSTNAEATAVGWNSQGNVTVGLSGNTSLGINTIAQCTTGCTTDTAIGQDVLRNVDSTGAVTNAVGIGNGALYGTTGQNGSNLIGIGSLAVHNSSATTASYITGIGTNDLPNITSAQHIVAVGHFSGQNETSGGNNAYVGDNSGGGNGASYNTCMGQGCLGAGNQNASSGKDNGFGALSLYALTSGFQNDAHGYQAGYALTTGNNNSLFGYQAGLSLTTGSSNTFLGAGCDNSGTPGVNYSVEICAGSTPVITVTGGNTPGTSVTSVAGSLAVVGSTRPATGVGVFSPFGAGAGFYVSNNTPFYCSSSVCYTSPLQSIGSNFTVSGCGTAGSITGGSAAGTFRVGTGSTTCTFAISPGTSATNGWVADVDDATAHIHCTNTTTVSTTTANVLCNATVATNDLITVSLVAY